MRSNHLLILRKEGLCSLSDLQQGIDREMGFFHNPEGHGAEGSAKKADSGKLQSLRTLRVETL